MDGRISGDKQKNEITKYKLLLKLDIPLKCNSEAGSICSTCSSFDIIFN